jgi:hypothetical protein
VNSARSTPSEVIDDADYWRGPPSDTKNLALYKEWQHFVVFGASWTLVFNLNLDGGGGGRVISMVFYAGWRGHVSRCREPRFLPGRIDATFERSGMRWREGRYHIWHKGEGTSFEGILEPVSTPSLSHNIGLGVGAHLSWCLVPRLLASGWFEVDGRRVAFDRCFAYHDHNWGRFRWGGDFSWEWGCAVPEDPASPWTIIFARMNDRAQHRTTATSVFLLRDGRHFRYFRNREVGFETQGFVDSRPLGRIPAAAALLLPDEDRDVPASTRFEARRGDDTLFAEIEAGARGQVLMPAETALPRIVRLNEVEVRVRVEGRCAGEAVKLRGPGLLEVLRG